MLTRYNQGVNAELQQAIAGGRTILTPNQRAARAIQRAFAAAQDQPFWTPARIVPLDAWLTGLWHERLLEGKESRILLNRAQQQVLWRESIVAEGESFTLRSPDALAEMAARAWNLLCLFKGRPRLRESSHSTDTEAFERWSRTFESRLRSGQSITAPQLPGELAAASDLTTGLTTGPITLVDFDSLTPAVADLFARLPHESVQTAVAAPVAQLCEAADDQAELEAAAHWIRAQRALDPSARISVVVPNLKDRRAAIERCFAPILQPESLPITAPAGAAAFEFSLGTPLVELPMAAAALDLLAWPLTPLAIERISVLLLSPWVGSGSAAPAIAAFDAFELRQLDLLRPELALETALGWLAKSQRPGLRELHQRFTSLQRSSRACPASQAFAAWADAFRVQLETVGWTMNVRSSSIGFQQQHRRWESALDELATLDFEGARPTAEGALRALSGILRETIFAPESGDAPVQIVGPLELGGVASDALWFLGADDLGWPASAGANPLIPWQLQRTLGMPAADRDRDDVQAQALTARLAQSAKQVVFSYGRRAEEGERRPSPLLAALNLTPFALPPAVPASPSRALDLLADDTSLPPLPDAPIAGGAQILKLQAACAFRAFAERRLWSVQPDVQQAGLDALERGNIVHAVMQHFWNEVTDQETLRRMGKAGWHAVLDRAIAQSFSRIRPETAWDAAYLRVQHQRLRDLLLPWIEIEAVRAGSFVVENTEEPRKYSFGSLRLSLRFDRIDSTAQGDILLDYKTGLARPAMWQGDRPDEPQMPLYAVLEKQHGRRLAAVAFAQLRPGDGLGLTGYADDEAMLAKTARMEGATLDEQIDTWEAVLLRLAKAFAAGDSRVLPKAYPRTCERCSQRILCRLNPETLDDEAAEDEPEGESSYG